MTTAFDHIIAIYNPNSTNDAATKARDFQQAAQRAGFDVTLTETTHAGHAEEIAQNIVRRYQQPLLISVSGDGGYNELINGVMQAKSNTTKQPVVAIIAAGNANDHKRTTRGDTPLLELMQAGATKQLDLLRLQTSTLDRYAHSYIGLGITPDVGRALNKHDLNRFLEVKLVWESFREFTPFSIVRDGKTRRYANLLFANVSSMSKILTLDPEANDLNDGKFELIVEPWRGKRQLLAHLIKLVIMGHPKAPQYSTYSFTIASDTTHVQLDGEIKKLPPNTEVTILSQQSAVLSLY